MASSKTTGRLSTLQLACVSLVLLLGAFLRFVNVADTVVDHPFRSDAAAYYKTAYNLHTFGVYSHDINESDGREAAPQPDALATPGYPLFLTLFVDRLPEPSVFHEVELWQALIGCITLLLVFHLFWELAGFEVGLAAMLLTAISPHQVDTTLFMVTETWFTLLLMAALAAFAVHLTGPRRFLPALLAAGALLGASALTRPVVEFFPLFLVGVLFLVHPRKQALKGSAVLLAGFLGLWVPWLARNEISLGRAGDPAVMVNTLTTGMYPDFEYDHNPASLAAPYRWDPRSKEINQNLGTALEEIGRRFREHPAEELEWYLVGKPVMLWSWEVIDGGWDAYVYPVYPGNPYDTNPAFRITHAVSYLLHWPLVLLAFATAIYCWLPRAKQRLQGPALVMARVVGLLLLYTTGVLMVLAPFVRYSIPFLPLVFGMAALGGLLLVERYRPAAMRPSSAAQDQ
jgi:4-amino-4-deoxy-L-arabinose transferase-like glycosyltransferase